MAWLTIDATNQIKGIMKDENLPLASAEGPGVVKPDGTTITLNLETGEISAVGAAVPKFITNEIVAGGPTDWTLAHIPLEGTLQLFSGSGAIWPGTDYTSPTPGEDTFATKYAIDAGTLHASYRY